MMWLGQCGPSAEIEPIFPHFCSFSLHLPDAELSLERYWQGPSSQDDFRIMTGNDESRFNVSLIVRGKVARQHLNLCI